MTAPPPEGGGFTALTDNFSFFNFSIDI